MLGIPPDAMGGGGTATPQAIPGMTSASSLAVGWSHVCARLSNSSVRCWGDNGWGQLGYEDNSATSPKPVAVPGITTATAIGLGPDHACVVLKDHTLRCWGRNVAGQLGNGTGLDTASPVKVMGISTAIAVDGGDGTTCALLSTDTVKCWGDDLYFPIGSAPTSISGISDAIALSVGTTHACVRISDGTARCWGRNSTGQLGMGRHLTVEPASLVSGLTDVVAIAAGPTTPVPRWATAP